MINTVLAPRRTIVDRALPGSGAARQIALIVGGSLLMALSAWVSIPLPFTPVPVTGQTYGILVVGALLGSRRGALALLAYLAEGLAGLPVFHAGANAWTPAGFGLPTILGPTAGYLLAAPVVAFVVGFLVERGSGAPYGEGNFWRAIGIMVIGEVVLYVGGVSWLAHFVGYRQAVQLGLIPFIGGDAVKLLLAAATLPAGWRLLGTPPGPTS